MLAELRAVEMDMNVDAAGCCDHAFGVTHRRRRAADHIGIDAVHGRRIAGIADPHDLAVLDTDIAFDDTKYRIDDERVAQQHVKRTHGAVIAGGEAEPVTQGLATAVQTFIAGHAVIVLDLGQK